MDYDLTRPCEQCPFLKKNAGMFTRDRVQEIADGMLETQGAEFSCHKTIKWVNGALVETGIEKHCAGALIFMEKHKRCHQMARIMERLRMYDARKLMSNKEVVATVCDSAREMMGA